MRILAAAGRRIFLLGLLGLCLAPAAAHTPETEPIVSGLSQDRIQITSTYNGTDLMIFGAVEPSAASFAGKTPDIAVLVRGPTEPITVRRKSRIAGIWLNTDKTRFLDMPTFYFAAATCTVAATSPLQTRIRHGLGFAALSARAVSGNPAEEPYVRALIRRLGATGMYTEKNGGVEMLSPQLFRVHVTLPAEAPRGRYRVEVYLFRGGALIGQQTTPLFVDQIGLERKIEVFSRTRPFAYGFLVLAMACLIGWAATLIARRR